MAFIEKIINFHIYVDICALVVLLSLPIFAASALDVYLGFQIVHFPPEPPCIFSCSIISIFYIGIKSHPHSAKQDLVFVFYTRYNILNCIECILSV